MTVIGPQGSRSRCRPLRPDIPALVAPANIDTIDTWGVGRSFGTPIGAYTVMNAAIRSVAAARKTVITTTRAALLASHLRR